MTETPPQRDLDLQRYRRPELAEHIHGVLAVQGDFTGAAAVVVGGIFVVWIASSVLLYESSWVIWGGVLATGSFTAFEMLTAGTAWWVLSRKLRHAINASHIVLEICLDAMNDLDAVAAGRATAPTPAAIVQSVFATVVQPTVEAQGTTSWMGRVLAWLYSRHTHAIERRVIDAIPDAHEPLPSASVTEQHERIKAAAEVIETMRDSGLRGLHHARRHVLPAFALAALSGTLLQAIPLVITTGLLAKDSRAPRVSGTLSSPTPLIDPATGQPACAVLLAATYDAPNGRTKESGEPVTQSATSFHLAEKSTITDPGTGEALSITAASPQPWASNRMSAMTRVPSGTRPDFLPSELETASNLSLLTDAVACGESHTLYGTQANGELTLATAPPLPAMRVAGGLFLLYLFHQFGAFPVVLALFYAAGQTAYLVYIHRKPAAG